MFSPLEQFRYYLLGHRISVLRAFIALDLPEYQNIWKIVVSSFLLLQEFMSSNVNTVLIIASFSKVLLREYFD